MTRHRIAQILGNRNPKPPENSLLVTENYPFSWLDGVCIRRCTAGPYGFVVPVYNEVEALDGGCGMGRNSSDVLVRYRHPSNRTLPFWAELIDACT